MKKKLIRNTLLLLMIPLLVTIIIAFASRKHYDFTPTVTSKGTAYATTYHYNKKQGDDFFININEYYPYMMFFGIFLVFVFFIFYSFLTRKKGW